MDLEKKRNNLGLYVYNVFADSSKKDLKQQFRNKVVCGLDPIFHKEIKYVFEQVVKYLKNLLTLKIRELKFVRFYK